MKLSILDQSPISSNQSARGALHASLKLAQVGESLGYTRYWIAEHHDLPGLACSAPEVMLSYIGSNTSSIRIGSGAILLPHYKPYKVAEVFHMLATLFPDRIDLGIGRAPGGSAEATNALSDRFLQEVWDMPRKVKELLQFIEDDFPSGHQYAKVSASPIPDVPPVPWLLGTSKKSALLAAEYGLPYTFGQFMSDNDGTSIVKQYFNAFRPHGNRKTPHSMVTVSVICAETAERAEEIASSSLIWSLMKQKGEDVPTIPSIEEAQAFRLNDDDQAMIAKMKEKMVIGNQDHVKQQLIEISHQYNVDEIMIVTITYSPQDKIRSYQLIADAIFS